MKKIGTILFFIILLSTFSSIPSGTADSQFEYLTLKEFSGGEFAEKTVTFESGGDLDNSLTFEVIKRANVTSAHFNVTAGSLKDKFPLDPVIDVGDDGDTEWAFSGTGYGRYGYQNEFSTGREEQLVFVPSSGVTSAIKIKIPRNAKVLSANMTIESTSVSDDSYNADQYIIVQDSNSKVYYAESYGDGTFDELESYGKMSQYTANSGAGIADFDNDGDLDFIIVTGAQSNQEKPVYYFEKIGTGKNFGDRKQVGTIDASTHGQDIGVGDFNNDKNTDFFLIGYGKLSGKIFYGNGDGSFSSADFSFGLTYSTGKAVADLDEDGALDLVALGGVSTSVMSVHWFRNKGDGTFNNKVDLNLDAPNGYGLVVEDFDGDGDMDIYYGTSDGKWYLTRGSGDGTFDPADTQYHGLDVGNEHPGFGDAYDFDFDGKVDIICAADSSSGKINYYKGNGDGTFRFPVEIGTTGQSTAGIAGPPTTSLGTPIDVELNIGDDAKVDWSYSGEFDGEVTLTGLATDLNNILQSLDEDDTYIDPYGNIMYDIPLKVSAQTPGNIILKNLQIRYEVTTTVGLNPHNGDLAHELNELLSFYESEYELNVTIPILLKTGSSGKLHLSNVIIDYRAPNRRPVLTMPRNYYTITEDSGRYKNLIDMNLYVDDDRWPEGTGGLRYRLMSNSHPEGIQAIIHSHYMDILPLKNFFGRVQFQLKVIDDGNDAIPGTADDMWSLSNYFNITVLPSNDAPRVTSINGLDPHSGFLQFNATEDELLNLTIEASDIDDDPTFPLKFTWSFQDGFARNIRSKMALEIIPASYFNESGSKIFVNTLSYIPGQYEVDLGSVYVTLYITDNNGSNPLNDIVQFVIRTININDAPKIKPISNYNVNEDSTLRFYVFATDEDGDLLTFSTNRTDEVGDDDLGNFTINSKTGLITFTPNNEDVGLIDVMVFVNDGSGEFNSITSRPFQILVNNTNDPPHVNRITYKTTDLDPKTPDIMENLVYNFTTTEPHDDDKQYGDRISYEWDFDASNGFQIEARGKTTEWEFPHQGPFLVTLRVRDSKGATNQTNIKVRVFAPEKIDDNDKKDRNETPVPEIFGSREAYIFSLIIIVVGIIIAVAIAAIIRKRKIKEADEEVTPFTDKDLKVALPEDLVRDLRTRIQMEKGIYTPPKNLNVPKSPKEIIGHTQCSTPAECRHPTADDLRVSLPTTTAGPPGETVPAALPPASEEAEKSDDS